MARLLGSFSASMFDPFKAQILSWRAMGMGVTAILRRLGFGSRQNLYKYLYKLRIIGENKTTKVALKVKMAWPLWLKVRHAKARIRAFYEAQKGAVYVAFSGGKDSTVLLHLVRSLYPDVKAVFCNTTNEYGEILQFVKATPNVITLKPKMSFNQIVETHGFPLVSKKVTRAVYDLRHPTLSNANSRRMYLEGVSMKGQDLSRYKLAQKWHFLREVPFEITNRCCDILKKEPFKRFEKQSGLRPIMGTMALESDLREKNYLKYGCNVFEGEARSRPLSIFSEKDIWRYIRKHRLPYAGIYDTVKINGKKVAGERRTGCAYCAFGAHLEAKEDNRFTRLAIRKPKQFAKMMALENNGVRFDEALKKVGVGLI